MDFDAGLALEDIHGSFKHKSKLQLQKNTKHNFLDEVKKQNKTIKSPYWPTISKVMKTHLNV